jgi:putative resolvase
LIFYAERWEYGTLYTPAQFAKRIAVSVKTIQKWDRLGILPAKRTITTRRYDSDDDLAAALHLPRLRIDRRTVAYCRVCSQAQKPDLENQKRMLEQYSHQQHIAVDAWITEIGGGMHFKRKQFLRLVDQILAGEVERVILAHQDRLARFGYSLLVHLCQTQLCQLVVMSAEMLSPEQELVQDLITITHCFSRRLYGLRNYRKALEKAIKDDQSAQDPPPSNA